MSDIELAMNDGRQKHWLARLYLRHEKKILGTITVVAFITLWELAGSVWTVVNPIFLSSPSRVLHAGVELYQSGRLLHHLSVSGVEFLLGYSISIVIGVPLGIALGWYQRFNYAMDPFINALYAAPVVAFLPLLVIWLGIGLASKLTLIVMAAVFPILMNARDAVKTTPNSLLEAARSFQASQYQIFRTVVLPSAVPFILAGLRLGAGRALIGVFVAELYIAQAGIGQMIAEAGSTLNTDVVLVGVVIFAVVGMTTLELLTQLERRFDKWRPKPGSRT
ncbi:ABC transporter permease [Rhodoplanes sp. Z2-YC6860]|uniref:ABC transporter permease n=1 Tax=Rhodoplanes sp. Z2-YC6860 TaxID=674703 RepID=UPI00078EB8EA|nr:ABC transporter permease [Rhodoplanes sp. Z2-YC6860]AMN41500.1 nitrate ABC transporter permease [Rhodoplanes sp. Z2-YC6860]